MVKRTSSSLCWSLLQMLLLGDLLVTGGIVWGAEPGRVVADKTLVAWVYPANLAQRGGSVLTLENPEGQFDAVVLGEIEPGRWMAGSEFFRRTHREQAAWPAETAGPETAVQVAIVYRGREVTIYRNGQRCAAYSMGSDPAKFDAESVVLMGLRHQDAGGPRFFAGAIDDARVYDAALDASTIASLRPNDPAGPKPWAWWSFDGDKAADRMGVFRAAQLVGGAKIADGRLHLPGEGSYLLASSTPVAPPRTRQSEDWPIWHVTALPEEGVCLPYDANGCIWWKGKYHLMYIFQDPKLPNGGHCWGHAVSTDLVNWTFVPPSVVPAPGDPDVGIFSGNAFVNKEGKPMLCWFGINAGVCVATADDDELIRWKKHPKNPIIPMPKPGEPGHGTYRVWDPYLWLEGDTYYCLLGGNELNGKDTLYLCKSPDLVNWKPVGPFYEQPDPTWTTEGEDCSCPDFFKLGDKHVLMCISHKIGGRCYVGRFDLKQEKFFPERHMRMNWPGGMFFAPESLLDGKGRRIFWAWVTDPRSRATMDQTGSGVQSMPRVLGLDESGRLQIAPVEELHALRRNHRALGQRALASGGQVVLDNVRGDSLELALRIDPGRAQHVGLKVRCSPDGREETLIWYDPAAKKLIVDMSKSTLRKDVVYSQPPFNAYFKRHASAVTPALHTVEAPLELREGELLELRVFLDKPMLEIFANGRQCVTQQIFPQSKDALGICLFARGGDATLQGGDAWDMAPSTFVDQKKADR